MENLDRWDWGLLALASFIAIVTLTRLMLSERNKLLTRLRTEMDQERAKKQQAERQKKLQEAKNKPRLPGQTTAA